MYHHYDRPISYKKSPSNLHMYGTGFNTQTQKPEKHNKYLKKKIRYGEKKV